MFSECFFGNLPGLDDDPCVKVTVCAGEMLVMPANIIHLVQTVGECVVFGANFVTLNHLTAASYAYHTERLFNVSPGECFPRFDVLVVLIMRSALTNPDELNLPEPQLRELWVLLTTHVKRPAIEQMFFELREHVSSYIQSHLIDSLVRLNCHAYHATCFWIMH